MNHELGTKLSSRLTHRAGIEAVQALRAPIDKMLAASSRFEPYEPIDKLAEEAEQVLSLCNTMGEGWLLTAEMVDLIGHGTPNIVCAQPFACLPNHVVGKAVIKRLRQMHPESNIVAVDYDPGASEVNQLNRIKLMISVAKENFRAGRTNTFELSNPADPTNFVVSPYVDELGRSPLADREINGAPEGDYTFASFGGSASACSTQTSCGAHDLQLTDAQLDRIHAAQRRAGVEER